MARNHRRKYFVDRQVQGTLMLRALVYVLLAVMLIALLSAICLTISDGPLHGRALAELMWSRFGPAFVASIFLLPIVVIDSIRLSNRFAGPMLRLRRAMKEAAAGRDVAPVKFRKGDFWYDFAEDFNQLLLDNKAAKLAADNNRVPSSTAELEPALSTAQ